MYGSGAAMPPTCGCRDYLHQVCHFLQQEFLRPRGMVKVLDFGLAKVREGSDPPMSLSNSPTLLSGSAPGVIMGTAAYMSPEQARGRSLDRRTDIFAFGCVLYEMLTGQPAFPGEDTTDIVSRVIRTSGEYRGARAAGLRVGVKGGGC
jgi:serine/threonine protein kinase